MKLGGHFLLLCLGACFMPFVTSHVLADDGKRNMLPSSPPLFEWKWFDVNSIECRISSTGEFPNLDTSSATYVGGGLLWPKGSGKPAMFDAGMWISGVHAPSSKLRQAVMDGLSQFQPGRIEGVFNTSTNDTSVASDPRDPLYRVYKINQADTVGGINIDYDEWPAAFGAPFVDVNGNGVWDRGIDRPRFLGDQELWVVYNDLIGEARKNYYFWDPTPPMGIEVQALYYGTNRSAALSNAMFIKWLIINKSDADYEDVYFSIFSDFELGKLGDNLAGVDTTLQLTFGYNGDDFDEGTEGYLDQPPACGFDLLQGPMVPGAVTDSTRFKETWRKGFRNLPLTAHVVSAVWGGIRDPHFFGGMGYDSLTRRRAQQGLLWQSGSPYINPVTGESTPFVFSGDPVTGTGWLPSLSNVPPSIVTSLLSSGPFSLAQGDTQEVSACFVIAQGRDRLESITALRALDLFAQDAFDHDFLPPAPPPAPAVKASALDREVSLSWYENHTTVESYDQLRFKFQGYNVYQGHSPSGPWKRVATYDVIDYIKEVRDDVYDPELGARLETITAFGTDTGLQRHLVITQDALEERPLVNGREYYFAVTSYNVYTGDREAARLAKVPVVLESDKLALTLIPHERPIGSTLPLEPAELVPTDRVGDDALKPELINPDELTGHTYTVSFNADSLSRVTSWNLKDATTGRELVSQNRNFSGTVTSPIFDGILWRVMSPPGGLRRDNQSPPGWSYSSPNVWFEAPTAGGRFMQSLVNPEGWGAFSAAMVGSYENQPSKVPPGELPRVEIRFTHDPAKMQHAYRYLRAARKEGDTVDPSFIPHINFYGYGFPYQGDYDQVRVPFTAWEVDPLDGDPAPRQLNVGFLENNDSLYSPSGAYLGLGKIDGTWEPTSGANGGREVIYIFNSSYSPREDTLYTKSPQGTGSPINLLAEQRFLDVLYVAWVKKKTEDSTWAEGEILTLWPNYALTPDRVYNVDTEPYRPKKGDVALMKAEMARINVFPNPYFAHNRALASPSNRFVTITNLPQKATVRIFSLDGDYLKTIHKDDDQTFLRWDLRNEFGLPVSSGIYLLHIEIPEAGNKILKLALIQPEEGGTK